MNDLRVSHIRRAIAELPDDAPIVLWQTFTSDTEGAALIELAGVGVDDERLVIQLDVTVMSDFDLDDIDDDDDDNEDDGVGDDDGSYFRGH